MKTYEYRVCLKGKSAHGSRPDLGDNTILCFSEFMELFPYFSTLACAKIISVTSGSSSNIIPDSLEFLCRVEVRETSEADVFCERFQSLLEHTARMHSCSVQFL